MVGDYRPLTASPQLTHSTNGTHSHTHRHTHVEPGLPRGFAQIHCIPLDRAVLTGASFAHMQPLNTHTQHTQLLQLPGSTLPASYIYYSPAKNYDRTAINVPPSLCNFSDTQLALKYIYTHRVL